MKVKYVLLIEKAYCLALFLGLFNFSYDRVRKKFRMIILLSFYNRCCQWIVYIISLGLFWAYFFMLCGLTAWQDTAQIQDRLMWYINIVQLYFGVFLTYNNHSLKQAHLLRMLNRIVKCNRNLISLLGEDVHHLRTFYVVKRIRIAAVIADIFITWNRSVWIQIITYEWQPLAVFNKIVLTSSFLGQHYVQTFIGTSFHRMECFVREKSGRGISAEECLLLSKISSQLHRIRLSSNAYHGAFGLISYLSLIRTICFLYSSFSALFTSGMLYMPLETLALLVGYFVWMMLPGLTSLVDIVLLGIAADAVSETAKEFYSSVHLIVHKSQVSIECSRLIETILQKEHLENMRTVITSGVVMDRTFSFEIVFETLSWVIATFIYNGGRYNRAIAAIDMGNFEIKRHEKMMLLSLGLMAAVWYCIRKLVVCLKCTGKRLKTLCVDDD